MIQTTFRLKRHFSYVTAAAAVLALAVSSLLAGRVYAAGGSIYFSPSSASVNNGSTVTVGVYANTGSTTVNADNVTLTFDSSKLSVQSVSKASSPLSQGPAFTASGGTIKGGGYNDGSAGSFPKGTILLVSITFKALTGSGSATLQLSTSDPVYPTEVDDATSGQSIGASLGGPATINFTTPATTTGGSTTTTTSKSSTTPSKTSTPATNTKTTNTTAPSTQTTPTTTTPTTTTSTDQPPTSGDVISKLHIGAYYRNNKPITNTKVTLHSSPQTVETDDKGVATFTDVPIGNHTVIFEQGGKSYSRTLTLTSVQASDTASVVSIVFDAAPPSGLSPAIFAIPLLLIIVGVLGYVVWRRRQDNGVFYPSANFAPATVMSSTPSRPQLEHNDDMDSLLIAVPSSAPTIPGATVSPVSAESPNEPTGGIPVQSLVNTPPSTPTTPVSTPAPTAPTASPSDVGKVGL